MSPEGNIPIPPLINTINHGNSAQPKKKNENETACYRYVSLEEAFLGRQNENIVESALPLCVGSARPRSSAHLLITTTFMT